MLTKEIYDLQLKVEIAKNDKAKVDILNELAIKFFKVSHYDDAIDCLTRALSIASSEEYATGKGNSLNTLGNIYLDRGDFNKALEQYNEALIIFVSLNNESKTASIIGNIGLVYRNLSNFDSALKYFHDALEIDKRLNNKSGMARHIGNIGTVYHFLSNFSKGLEYYYVAIELEKEIGNTLSIAMYTSNIGILYQNISEYSKALEYHEKGLRIYELLGNNAGIARQLSSMGVLFNKLSQNSKAIEYLNKSIEINKKLSLKVGLASDFTNIGIVYMSNLDFSKALEFFQRAYSIYKEIGNKYGMSAVLCNIGSIYQKIYSYNKALKYLNKALVMDEELGINGGVAINNIWIGHIYADRNTELYNPKKAADHYLKAIFINETIGAKQNLYSTHQHLSALYKQEKRWEEYAEHIEKYHELYIEVQSEEVKKQADRFGWERKIAEMEKQKEIDLLKTEAEKLNMQQKIEFQAREVENTIHELIKKNNLLQQVQSGILKIKPHTKGEAIAHIEQLLDRVSRNITPLESISELDKQWTEVHKDFMNKLKGSFPDLTAMELKIAALLTMKLTSSNIASVLFLSKRTVESHRHSLRKKMGISVADDIYTVLTTYSH